MKSRWIVLIGIIGITAFSAYAEIGLGFGVNHVYATESYGPEYSGSFFVYRGKTIHELSGEYLHTRDVPNEYGICYSYLRKFGLSSFSAGPALGLLYYESRYPLTTNAPFSDYAYKKGYYFLGGKAAFRIGGKHIGLIVQERLMVGRMTTNKKPSLGINNLAGIGVVFNE